MLSHRSIPESDRAAVRAGARIGALLTLLTFALALAGLLVVSGCGGGGDGGDGSVVLAKVGDTEITAGYYESKLGKLEQAELPKGDDGQPLDMAQLEGKKRFLETMINKELMARKATDLGYGSDPQVTALKESMTSYEANLKMWNDVVNEPTSVVSPEQLQAFYDRMGEVRVCSYVLTNFKADAEAAREFARTGADWSEVVAKYHDGAVPPTGKYEIKIPYGRYNMDFDTDVFETAVGDVAPPIASEYGYWVLRVDSVQEEQKPNLEEAKSRILDTFRNRRMAEERKKFIEGVREKYDFFIDEDALWIAYSGLPENEVMLDPQTKQPTPREQLEPLDVPVKELDRIFYGYTMDGEKKEYTIADYKNHFDRMSVFQRPKKGEMLGGMRQKITQELDKALLNREAEARGYFQDPDVVAKVKDKVEEVMVTKLYDDVVTFDDIVTPEQLNEFWTAHEADYAAPELRSGRLVVCQDEAQAEKAAAYVPNAESWREVLTRFGTDAGNKQRSGKLDNVSAASGGPVAAALFALKNSGDVSQPFEAGDGRWAIVQLNGVTPPRQQTLDEVRDVLGQRIRNLRREESFQALLSKWAEEYGVTRYEDRLADVASWDELTVVELPGTPLPR